jgi:hypothetical protein
VLRWLRAWCSFFALATALVGPGAIMAAADDGPARPTRTVLRPTEIPELAASRAPARSPKEAVILVSGINSYPQDPTFDPLIARLFGDPRYEIFRFGADPAYPYDTLGDLDVSARSLRDEARALGGTHGAVHIVTHSMGGVVADRAFASGLSARDGVATYAALASPHSGSPALAVGGSVLSAMGDRALETRALFSAKLDPGSEAASGLGRTRPVAPPAGVVRLDLRTSTDWTVTKLDARDPGVESRTLMPPDLMGYADGHGSITRDPEALRLVLSTIEHRAIPSDPRSTEVKLAAEVSSLLAARIALLVLLLAVIGAGCTYVGLHCVPGVRLVTRPLAQYVLRAARRK